MGRRFASGPVVVHRIAAEDLPACPASSRSRRTGARWSPLRELRVRFLAAVVLAAVLMAAAAALMIWLWPF
jgi:hypothetical protein